MSQPKYADPARIKAHANDIDTDVVPKVKKAGDTLNGDGVYNLEGGDFSSTCILAAGAYPIAVQFAFEDVKMLMHTAKEFSRKVHKAADSYSQSEASNTIK